MKKSLFCLTTLLISFVGKSQTSNCDNLILNEPFTPVNNWVEVGNSEVEMQDGNLVLLNAHGGIQNFIYKQLNEILPDSLWNLKIDINIDNFNASNSGAQCNVVSLSNGTSNFFGSFLNGNYTDSNQDGMGIVIGSDINENDINFWHFRIESKKNSTRDQNLDQGITLNSTYSKYYLEMKRENLGLINFSVYVDSLRTIHLAGSPINIEIDEQIGNLNVIQTGTYVPAYGTRTISATISDLVICNEITNDIVENSLDKLVISPNPFNDYISLSEIDNLSTIVLYTNEGKLVRNLDINSTIKISDLETGIYYLEIILNNGQKVIKKIIKD